MFGKVIKVLEIFWKEVIEMDYELFFKKLPIKLNEQQQEAVQAVNGPILLLAVPGSGKTTVLVTRLGYMIYCHGIHPSNILTLTYTVAATNDMRARFGKLFGEELANGLAFRTINGVCAGIIKYYGNRIGKEPYALESDEKVLLAILSGLYQRYEKEYPTESDLKGIKTLITYIKNRMLSEEQILELGKENKCHLLEIYKEYDKALKERKCMDYDDQMVYAYRLLKSVPWLLEYYQDMYPYICVDEAQDTSKIQHEIIALLAAKNKNLFMVGDEDQSIYGFRAAYPEALLSFEKNYSNAMVLLMEENYRSNANIVKAADKFIQKNTLRHEKHMKATKEKGTEIKEIQVKVRGGQYAYLLKVAQDCREESAVLYRENESVLPLVDLLEREQVSYRIRNAELSFFTNRVVVDVLHILQFSENMKNAELFEKIYYKLSTYLNKQMALEACHISREYNISIFSAIFGYLELKPQVRKNLKAIETHFNNMRNEAPAKAIYRILHYMGYGEYLERNGLGEGKIFTLKTIAGREQSIQGFLERMKDLEEIIRNKENDRACKFILSTIHSSKGLEYDNVYLIDVQDGIFPEEIPRDMARANKDELETYEEARRLFYVAVTRAKNNLYLFQTQEPSTFIRQLLNKTSAVEVKKESGQEKVCKTFSKDISYMTSKGKVSEKEYADFVGQLGIGMSVVHKKQVKGIIISMDDTYITILFGEGEKRYQLKILFANHLLEI